VVGKKILLDKKKGKKPAPLNTQKSWTLKRRESRIPAIENNRKNRNKKIEKTRKNIGRKKIRRLMNGRRVRAEGWVGRRALGASAQPA